MCVVSMIGDFFNDKRRKTYPWIPQQVPTPTPTIINPAPSQAEFDKLKLEVELLKELLAKSKEYDEKNNEPDCEIDEKMAKLREIAKLVGIDLDDVLKKKK